MSVKDGTLPTAHFSTKREGGSILHKRPVTISSFLVFCLDNGLISQEVFMAIRQLNTDILMKGGFQLSGDTTSCRSGKSQTY
ncbi:hypothetical protein CSB45_05510 [candidate division KSB3 bacterium]|uniref:Uncharacterized protein n=1 Tax=candidate division KSB3 bacterium TaxID=2044937 RepID=A0A2G6E728_9BACT|nr:MAG: hypothetical protein CSB45_05510 [candidate division KSB3 bacterium]